MISIIVPVYNVVSYLEKCVDSLKAQTYKDTEIILVDDGSSDGSGALCDALAKTDGRIKVIHKNNGGPPSAWKAGITASAGEYIGFMDSDDYCDEDYFENLLSNLTKNDADIVIGGYIEESENSVSIKDCGSAYLSPGTYAGDDLENIKQNFFERKYTLYWARWLRLYKRDILLKNLHFVDENIRLGDEIGIALATLFDAKRIVIAEMHGYHYIYRKESIMHSYSDSEIENFNRLCKNIETVCDAKGYKNHLCREFTTQMLIVAMRIAKAKIPRKQKIDLLARFRNSDYVKRIFAEKDYGLRSAKGKLGLRLFRGKHYFIISLI